MEIEYRVLSERGFNYLVFWYSLFPRVKKFEIQFSFSVVVDIKRHTLDWILPSRPRFFFFHQFFNFPDVSRRTHSGDRRVNKKIKALRAKKKFICLFSQAFLFRHRKIYFMINSTLLNFHYFPSLFTHSTNPTMDIYFPSLLHRSLLFIEEMHSARACTYTDIVWTCRHGRVEIDLWAFTSFSPYSSFKINNCSNNKRGKIVRCF